MISEEIYLYMVGLYFHKHNYLTYYFEFQSFLRTVMTHLQRRIVVSLWTWHDKQEKFVDKKTKKRTTEHTTYKIVTWKKVMSCPSSAKVNLFVFLAQRRPSLLTADR